MSDSWSDVDLVMTTLIETCLANEKYFGDLDSVVGDGDFGYSLARGFEKLQAQYGELDRTDIGTFFKKVGMLVTSRIGGTSGPIWGTGFLRAGMTAGATTTLDGAAVVAMLRSAVAGIMARGGAELGDKTLLDALVPMTDAIEEALAAGVSSGEVVDRARWRRGRLPTRPSTWSPDAAGPPTPANAAGDPSTPGPPPSPC